jgi:transposase
VWVRIPPPLLLERIANLVSLVRRCGMGAYSKDLRMKTVAAVKRGIARKEVVETFGISLATLKRWLKIEGEGGDLSPGVSTGRKRRILATDEQKRALWEQLEENGEATLERHRELWEGKMGVAVSISTMSRAIRHRLGWTYKKRRWEPPSETKRRGVLGESV